MWFMEEQRSLSWCYTSLKQQEGHRMNGAQFAHRNSIYPENIIINGFHFPYPLNGT